jgi:hypothetical protein
MAVLDSIGIDDHGSDVDLQGHRLGEEALRRNPRLLPAAKSENSRGLERASSVSLVDGYSERSERSMMAGMAGMADMARTD